MTDELRALARRDEPLAHLLGCLDRSAELLNQTGATGDALVIESHRAQLKAGRTDQVAVPAGTACRRVAARPPLTTG